MFDYTNLKVLLYVMESPLTLHDQKVISDIVSHFPNGERVKILRSIFKNECSFSHYLFLGEKIGQELKHELVVMNERNVLRMKNLMFLN